MKWTSFAKINIDPELYYRRVSWQCVTAVFLNPEPAEGRGWVRETYRYGKLQGQKANLKSKKRSSLRRCAIFRPKSSEEQKNVTPRKFCAFSPSTFPLDTPLNTWKKKLGICPPKQVYSYDTGYNKTFASLYCQHVHVKKVIYRVLQNKDMAKWQILKWSEEDMVKFLNIQKLRSFVGHL